MDIKDEEGGMVGEVLRTRSTRVGIENPTSFRRRLERGEREEEGSCSCG